MKQQNSGKKCFKRLEKMHAEKRQSSKVRIRTGSGFEYGSKEFGADSLDSKDETKRTHHALKRACRCLALMLSASHRTTASAKTCRTK